MSVCERKRARWSVVFVAVASVLSVSAIASPQQEVTGRVSSLTSQSIVVRDGGRYLEFDRKSISGSLPEDLKVGDRVTIKYSLKAEEIHRTDGQQPGRVAPKDVPSAIPGELDDRGFYSATNTTPDD